jgi:signal transduction histidine kinase
VGLGLGLYIAHEIAQRHGGRLAAENAPHGGAIFTLTLPLLAARPHHHFVFEHGGASSQA